MKRLLENDLLEWKNRPKKMPLLVYGARQTGKTTTIFEFGKSHFSNVALFNFEANERLSTIFDGDINPQRNVPLKIWYAAGYSISLGTLRCLNLWGFVSLQGADKRKSEKRKVCSENHFKTGLYHTTGSAPYHLTALRNFMTSTFCVASG